MTKYRLLRSQKNSIYESLKTNGINHFDLNLEDKEQYFKLLHKDTDHFFHILYDPPYGWNYKISYSPAKDTWQVETFANTWADVLKQANYWAEYLAREVLQPDAWTALLKDTAESFRAEAADDNRVFTEPEKNEIKNKLNQIERFLIDNYDLTPERKKLISEKLDRLEQLAENSGRNDWLHTTIGVTFTIIIGVGLAPTQAKELAQFVGKVLSQLFGGSLPLLP